MEGYSTKLHWRGGPYHGWRDDAVVPFEAGCQLAAGIRGARFIALAGRNHLFMEHEPASDRFFEEISLFLRG